jgi:hypothetical protein
MSRGSYKILIVGRSEMSPIAVMNKNISDDMIRYETNTHKFEHPVFIFPFIWQGISISVFVGYFWIRVSQKPFQYLAIFACCQDFGFWS